MRAVVGSLPAEVQDAIGTAIQTAVAPYFDGAGMHFPAEMIVARATRA